MFIVCIYIWNFILPKENLLHEKNSYDKASFPVFCHCYCLEEIQINVLLKLCNTSVKVEEPDRRADVLECCETYLPLNDVIMINLVLSLCLCAFQKNKMYHLPVFWLHFSVQNTEKKIFSIAVRLKFFCLF